MRVSIARAIFLPLLAGLVACTGLPPVPNEPLQFSEVPPSPKGEFPNWPADPLVALAQMQHGDVEVRSRKHAGAGTTGAQKLELYFKDVGDGFDVKSKAMPRKLDGINNNPRREFAAWEIQQFFLDPEDFVVPTTTARCISLEMRKEHSQSSSPQVPGTNCVLLVGALWLDDLQVPDQLFDPHRFLTEPRYAYHLANFNLLTYLINIRDNRKGNILVSKNSDDRRVFAIDNGVSFGTGWFNWFSPRTFAWRKIRVPALPKKSIDRLRALTEEDLDSLAVLIQFEADDRGMLQIVENGPPIDEEEGVRIEGGTVQLGLNEDEIENIWERIEHLLEEIDDGGIPLF